VKRWLLLCVAALVALVAVGCGGGSDNGGGGGSATADSNAPATITVWYWGVPDPRVMRQIDADYMAAHPNITIKRVVQPGTTFPTLMRSTVAARKGPDVFAMFASPFLFDYLPGVQSLEKYVTRDDIDSHIGYSQITTADGKPQGVPFDANGNVIYYDRAKFAKAGIDAPPTTFDELLTDCDKLNAAGIVPIQAGWKDGGYLEWWLSLLVPQYQSDQMIGDAVTKPSWTDDSIHRAMDLIRQMYDRKCFTPDSQAIPLFPDTVNNFKAGKAAMMVGLIAADVHWQQFRQTKWGKTGLGAFLAPLVPGGNWDTPRLNYTSGLAYVVTRWSKVKDQAAAYAKYLSSPEVQTRYFGQAGEFPTARTATPAIDDPVGKQLLDYVRTNDPYGGQFSLIRATVEGVFLKYVPDLVTGKKSWDDIQGQLQEQQDRGAQ